MRTDSPSLARHFEGRSPEVRRVYDRVLAAARRLGPVEEDPKKTSIHLNRRTAFAGVATRRERLILTLKASRDIASPRVTKHEQASARRWHLEIPLSKPSDVNAELVGWLREAYELSA